MFAPNLANYTVVNTYGHDLDAKYLNHRPKEWCTAERALDRRTPQSQTMHSVRSAAKTGERVCDGENAWVGTYPREKETYCKALDSNGKAGITAG